MYVRTRSLLVCQSLLFIIFSPSTSAQVDPSVLGFSGVISVNAGYIRSQSQHNTHDDNAVTQDLSNSGKKVNQVSPMLLGRLQYNFGKTIIFFGNSEDQITEANFQAELGVSQKVGRNMAITTALFGSLPRQDEVWRDPYLTGVSRSVTDHMVSGLRVAMDLHGPLSASLKYAYAQSEVETEEIGFSQSLSDAQRSLLMRDSDYHRFGVESALPISRSFTLVPAIYYSLRDAEGRAHSFEKIDGQIALAFHRSNHTLTSTFRLGSEEYDAENPVFNRKQDQQSFGFFSVYRYQSLLGLPNTNLNLMAGYQQTDSEIDFYSSENLFLSTGVSFQF